MADWYVCWSRRSLLTYFAVDISIDPFTGRNPGYVFVDVPDQSAFDLAMQILPGRAVRGRPIKVNAAGARKTVGAPGTEARVRSYDRWSGRSVEGIRAGVSDHGPGDFDGGSFAFNRWAKGEHEAAGRWEAPAVENRSVQISQLYILKTY